MANKHLWDGSSRFIDQVAQNRLMEEALAQGITNLPFDATRDALIAEIAAGSFGGKGGEITELLPAFDDAAARDAALPEPTEGQKVLLRDTGEVQEFSAGAWVVRLGASGALEMVADRLALDTFLADAEDDTAVVDKLSGVGYRVLAHAPVTLFDRPAEVVNAKSHGARADQGAAKITAEDIAAHPEWGAFYEVGDTWDYVGIQEAFFAAFLKLREQRTVAAGSTTTVVQVSGAAMTVDAYKGGSLWLTSGAHRNERRFIVSNTATTLTLSSALTAAPSAGDTIQVVQWRGGESDAQFNLPVYIPRGSYTTNKTLFVQHVLGGHIYGAGRFSTDVSCKTERIPTFQTNGMSYTWVQGIQFGTRSSNWAKSWQPNTGYGAGEFVVGKTTGWLFECTTPGITGATVPAWSTYSGATTINDGSVVWTRVSNTPIVDLDWDGRGEGWSGGLQSNTFANCKFTGQGRGVPNGVAIARSGDGSMGSENTFLNCYWQWFVMSGLHSNGLNALQNTIIGGNIAQVDLYGVYCERGAAYVYSCGFQNGVASQYDNGGADFRLVNSVADHSIASGCRSESLVFAKLGADHMLETHGCYSTVTNGTWRPGAYTVGTLVSGASFSLKDGRLWRCKVAGNAGVLALADTAATSGTATTISVAGAGWTPDQFKDKSVKITSGTGAGQTRYLLGNTDDTITIDNTLGQPSFNPVPDGTSHFEIYTEPKWMEQNPSATLTDGTVVWECLDATNYSGGIHIKGGMHAWGKVDVAEYASIHSSFFSRPDWIDAPNTFNTGGAAGRFLQPALDIIQARVYRNTYATPLSGGDSRWNPQGVWPFEPYDSSSPNSPSAFRSRRLSVKAITELGAGSALYFSNRHGSVGVRRGDFEGGEMRRILAVEGRLGRETPNNHDSDLQHALTYPTDADGEDLQVTGGLSTGAGTPGRVVLEAASPGATGATVNLPKARAAVTPTGLVVAPGLGADPVQRDVFRATAWDPGAVANGAFATTDVTVFGAVPGDVARAAFAETVGNGYLLDARVVADDTVRLTFFNFSGVATIAGTALDINIEVRSRQAVPAGTGDIALLVAALGGDGEVLGIHDWRTGVVLDGSGRVQDWEDARGAVGFGPTLTQASAGNRPLYDTVNGFVDVPRGTSLNSAAVAAYDLGVPDHSLIVIFSVGAGEAGGQNGYIGVNGGGGASLKVGADSVNTTERVHYFGRFRNSARVATPAVADPDPFRLMVVTMNGTTATVEVFDTPVASTTTTSAAGDGTLNVNDPGRDGAFRVKAVAVVGHTLSDAEKALVRQWAMSRHEPYMA